MPVESQYKMVLVRIPNLRLRVKGRLPHLLYFQPVPRVAQSFFDRFFFSGVKRDRDETNKHR